MRPLTNIPIKYYKWIIAFLLVVMNCNSTARESIRFSCAIPSDSKVYKELLLLYRNAFNALNIDFSFISTDPNQSMKYTLQGHTDGECAAIEKYREITGFSKTVMVDAPVLTTEIQLWSHNADETMAVLDNLSTSNLTIGYVQGTKWASDYLANQQAENVITVFSLMLGMKMLATQKLDLYLIPDQLAQHALLASPSLRDAVHLVGPISTIKFYPYLQLKHQHLVIPLAAELQRLIGEKQSSTTIPSLESIQPTLKKDDRK
ncbi:hypothetical protein LCGC14_2293830 [marine sediment metagenome]|uniref:Solute-binding protein family 3/N-terminal domain-containing protein n=1 Tax=marine sediment metagenome TaxID=412755 RepID=A0A0F9DD16_9ZZZZ